MTWPRPCSESMAQPAFLVVCCSYTTGPLLLSTEDELEEESQACQGPILSVPLHAGPRWRRGVGARLQDHVQGPAASSAEHFPVG